MTVAYPTTGIAVSPDAVDFSCSSCGTRAALIEPFCAHCGSRITLRSRAGIASIAATRAAQFAVLAVAANILVGGATFGVVFLLSDAARLTQGAVALEALRFVVVGSLVALAIRAGARGLRETADGMLRRRGWAIAGITGAGILGVLISASFAATVALYVLL